MVKVIAAVRLNKEAVTYVLICDDAFDRLMKKGASAAMTTTSNPVEEFSWIKVERERREVKARQSAERKEIKGPHQMGHVPIATLSKIGKHRSQSESRTSQTPTDCDGFKGVRVYLFCWHRRGVTK